MRITAATLAAFKSYQGQTFDLDANRVVVAGVNGSGKTSIREAIKWVLTGRCQGLDGKGSGIRSLIPMDKDDVGVQVTVADLGAVTRTAGGQATMGSFTVEGVNGSPSLLQGALYAKLNTSPAFLNAALDSRSFIELHHAEAKALVLELLAVSVTVGDRTYSLNALDAAYDQAFKDRTAAKRVLQGMGPLPTVTPYEGPELSAIQAQIGKLQTMQQELVGQVGQTIGSRKVLTASLERLRALPIPDLSHNLDAEIEAVTDRLRGMVEVATAPSEAVPVEVFKSRRDAAMRHDPVNGCVIDPLIPCKTARKQFTTYVELATKQIEEASPGVPAHEVERQDLVSRLAGMEKLRQQRNTVIARKAQTATDIAKLEAELKALPDTSQMEEALLELRNRILKGETLVAAYNNHQKAVQAHEAAVASREAAKAEVARLESLCEVLGPSGARVQALKEKIVPFETQINAALAVYGWEIRFQMEPWDVIVNDRPVDTYSKSELHRIGIAVQLAIAEMSGLDFAIVDEMDMLDAASRKAMNQILVDSPVGQILVLGTREPNQPLPSGEGVKSYRVGKSPNGVSTVVEAH